MSTTICSMYNSDENWGGGADVPAEEADNQNSKEKFPEYALKIDKSGGNRRTSLMARVCLPVQGTWV